MIKQMKGKMYDKLPKSYSMNFAVLASIKYDGRYTQIHVNKEEGVTFYSSGGKEFRLSLTLDDIDYLFNLLPQFNEYIIEAELINKDGRLGGRHQVGIQLTWVTNTAKGLPNNREGLEAEYTFKMFNIIAKMTNGKYASFRQLENLKGSSDLFKPIQQTILYNLQEVKDYAKDVINDGYEGIVCVELEKSSLYEEGKRVNYITKHKQINESIVTILNVIEGEGKYITLLGAFVCRTNEGKTFRVGSGLADSQRVPIDDAFDLIGQQIEIEYESLVDGVPQQPVFKRFVGED
jgi:ATP-dependent DNA ligase